MASIFRRLKQRLSLTESDTDPVRSAAPRLDSIIRLDGSTQVRLASGRLSNPATHVALVGRREGYERLVPLAAADPERPDSGWIVIVDDEVLERFGTDTINLFVTVGGGSGTGSGRQRVESEGTDLTAGLGGPWRWYTTSEGNLSIRRPTAVEVIRESGAFDADHYRAQLPDLPADVDLIEHYVTTGATDGLDPSSMFDTSFYQVMNPSLRRRNPFAHYCEQGWKELFDPSPRFSTWWYWFTNMRPAQDQYNPLAHFEATGKHLGLSTRPDPWPSQSLTTGHRLDGSKPIRRVCLFAGWDPDGIVDDYVVDYVRELARFADVFYLADCELPESELAKLAAHTKGAWGVRHGEYDFGSYARLTELVGWATLEEYDELLLVNDSCYLLRPLDEVFTRMAGSACDWWGLQATKGIRETRRVRVNQFLDPIPMERVRSTLVNAFEHDYTYDFLIGSYFLAFRRPVIRDPALRWYLGSVAALDMKRHVVKTYEVGLTHWLIQHGHTFDTFIPRLYPFHPIFTRWYFRLLDDGFPVLKRYFLAENHYQVPDLVRWPELVRQRVPDADIEVFERNLVRVTDAEKLQKSLRIGKSALIEEDHVPDALLDRAEFVRADVLSPKFADWWAFPLVDPSGAFSGNLRAVFEEIKNDPTIHKVVLANESVQELDGISVEVLPLNSPRGQHRLMRSGTVLTDADRTSRAIYPISGDLHNIVLMPHEVPVRRAGYAAEQHSRALELVAENHSRYRAIVGPSGAGFLAAVAAGYPLTIHQVWPTGLPRHDFITRPEERLPEDLREELTAVRDLVGDRHLVLYVPAEDWAGRRFTSSEVAWLASWLTKTGSVLGVLQSDLAGQLPAVDLSALGLRHVELLHRAASIMITDDAGPFADYALTGKPLIGFVPDESARRFVSPLVCDLDLLFPGPLCRTFPELQLAMDVAFDGAAPLPGDIIKRRLLTDRIDDQNSARVVDRIRNLVTVHGIGTWSGERLI